MSHGGLFDLLEMMLIIMIESSKSRYLFIFVTYFHDQTGLNIQIGFYFQ